MGTKKLFVVAAVLVICLMAGFIQAQTTVWWGSEVQISLPDSNGDTFSINWEEDCYRRTMSFSGTSDDTLEKTITVRCLSYGADSVRIVLGNYNLPMFVSFGQDNPVYCPEIITMPHIIKSGIAGDSIIFTLKFKGTRNLVFFVNEIAYKYSGGTWNVHHDFSVPTFAGIPINTQKLKPVTGEFLSVYQSLKFAKEGETVAISYRFSKTAAIAVGDTLYFANFLGEQSSAGVVYPDDLGNNDLTCRVIWKNSSHLPGYFFNTTVYVAKKNTYQTGVKKTTDTTADLFGGYPNPFNPSTNIEYHLTKDGRVTLAIYNIRGQEVTGLVDNDQMAGSHSVVWSGTDNYGQQVPSGVYYAILWHGGVVKNLRLTLLK